MLPSPGLPSAWELDQLRELKMVAVHRVAGAPRIFVLPLPYWPEDWTGGRLERFRPVQALTGVLDLKVLVYLCSFSSLYLHKLLLQRYPPDANREFQDFFAAGPTGWQFNL